MSDLDPAVPAEPEGDTLTDTGTQSDGLDGYTPREIVANDLGNVSLEDAISGTIVEFDDGDIVKGTVVKVDKDEVLLDIGF